MTRPWTVMVALAAMVVVPGCSEESGGLAPEICDNGVDDNGDGLADCADPQCQLRLLACRKDAALPAPDLKAADGQVTPDAAVLPPLALQTVANRLLLPKKGDEYGLDLTGNGSVDNKLGQVIAGLTALYSGLDLQSDLDDQVKTGKLLLLHELLASSLTDASTAGLRAYFGLDTDGTCEDNFSGSETFELAPITPGKMLLSGTIKAGKMAFGPGELMAPIAVGKVYVILTLKKAYFQATVSAKGMAGGVMAGAIPLADVSGKLLPAMATEMTRQLQDPLTTPGGLTMLKFFDQDKDGVITVKELSSHALIKTVLLDQPDVDTDGDKKPDAISAGLGFTAVTCKIKK